MGEQLFGFLGGSARQQRIISNAGDDEDQEDFDGIDASHSF